jgi:hypothetical protein
MLRILSCIRYYIEHFFYSYTLTTKVSVSRVIKTIKQHAFVTSEFPVILSIGKGEIQGQADNVEK